MKHKELQVRGLVAALVIGLASAHAFAADVAKTMAPAKAATPSKPSATQAPDVAVDPAGAWTYFLANAPFDTAYAAYDAVQKVDYSTETGVDADKCRTEGAALRDALALAPISISLHRAAMLCAEATGDEAGAERELKAIAALSKLAWANASESRNGPYVRVLRPDDVYAFLAASGLEFKYAYYEQRRATYYFPLTVAAWDPERKVERHLRFDYVDATHALARTDEMFPYPIHRAGLVDAYVQSYAQWENIAAIDAMGWRTAWTTSGLSNKAEKLRSAVGAGGLQSARIWIDMCSEREAPKGCSDGLVDALLPLAEDKQALAMALVAYAYAEGLGVPRDAAASDALLAAADARWSHMGASVEFAERWREGHSGAMPAGVRQRVERALAAGNDNARRLLIADKRAAKAELDAADIAYLQSPGQNGRGAGFAVLADDARNHKRTDDSARWTQRAAQAGDPRSRATHGSALMFGHDVPKDRAAGLREVAEAANGGNDWSARMMAWDARNAGDYVAAERWLLDSAIGAFDMDSLLDLAELYLGGYPGVAETPEKGLAYLKWMSDFGVPAAHRRLAQLHMFGLHVKQDPVEARRLLMLDAQKGDHASEAALGVSLLNGTLGPVDEREGLRWVERAIAGGDDDAADGYAYWLYFKQATPASRTKAMQVWQAAYARGADSVNNNYAWVLCTTPDDAFRNAKLGLEVAAKMGDVEDLSPMVLDTVAACRAAAGDYAGAQDLQKRAIAMVDKTEAAAAKPAAADANASKPVAKAETPADAATNAALEASKPDGPGYRERLALYAAGKPFLDTKHKD